MEGSQPAVDVALQHYLASYPFRERFLTVEMSVSGDHSAGYFHHSHRQLTLRGNQSVRSHLSPARPVTLTLHRVFSGCCRMLGGRGGVFGRWGIGRRLSGRCLAAESPFAAVGLPLLRDGVPLSFCFLILRNCMLLTNIIFSVDVSSRPRSR